MNIEPLQLTKRDIELLKSRKLELGRGTDGIIYKTGNRHDRDSLYKIYHKSYSVTNTNSNIGHMDKEGVKVIDDISLLKNITNYSRYKTQYINEEGTRVNGINSVYKAIERQKYIQRTKLQKRPIYIDGNFGGTVLHYHKKQLPIGILKLFPLNIQLKVLRELLISEEELLDNYIYHVDLSLKTDQQYKKANVLLSCYPFLYPNIIDIDGKSAVYTESYNSTYYQKSLRTYKNLVTEILFDIDSEKIDDADYEYLNDKLSNLGIKEKFILPILDVESFMDINCIHEFLDDMDKIYEKGKQKRLDRKIYR